MVRKNMINIGILGLGTVGTGLVEILNNKTNELSIKIGHEIIIKKILVQDINKNRDVPIEKNVLTTDFNEILNDESISIVLELTSSIAEAYDYIHASLFNKKHVVTANKAVLSKHFEELSELAAKNNVALLYEASVGGGIPILKTLKELIRSNEVTQIHGILNGTCNYILSEMFYHDIEYHDVLKAAQALGYAEADPSSDVKGYDTKRKLRILSTLAFGGVVSEDDVICIGIENIKSKDVTEIKKLNATVKLIGEGNKTPQGYTATVIPNICKNTSYFNGVNNAYNSVVLKGDYSGILKFYGPGAGKHPTSSAVLSDLLDIITQSFNLNNPLGNNIIKNINKDIKGQYYLRVDHFENTPPLFKSKMEHIYHHKSVEKNSHYFFTKEVLLEDMLDLVNQLRTDQYFLAKFQDFDDI